jgi:hypothetical protein
MHSNHNGVYLWLDDIRDPKKFSKADWTWVKTAAEAIAFFRQHPGQVECASLDHDLTQEQMVLGGYNALIHDDGVRSGYDVVCWLEQNPEYWPIEGVAVHSQNPAGADRMKKVIRAHYGRNFWFLPNC